MLTASNILARPCSGSFYSQALVAMPLFQGMSAGHSTWRNSPQPKTIHRPTNFPKAGKRFQGLTSADASFETWLAANPLPQPGATSSKAAPPREQGKHAVGSGPSADPGITGRQPARQPTDGSGNVRNARIVSEAPELKPIAYCTDQRKSMQVSANSGVYVRVVPFSWQHTALALVRLCSMPTITWCHGGSSGALTSAGSSVEASTKPAAECDPYQVESQNSGDWCQWGSEEGQSASGASDSAASAYDGSSGVWCAYDASGRLAAELQLPAVLPSPSALQLHDASATHTKSNNYSIAGLERNGLSEQGHGLVKAYLAVLRGVQQQQRPQQQDQQQEPQNNTGTLAGPNQTTTPAAMGANGYQPDVSMGLSARPSHRQHLYGPVAPRASLEAAAALAEQALASVSSSDNAAAVCQNGRGPSNGYWAHTDAITHLDVDRGAGRCLEDASGLADVPAEEQMQYAQLGLFGSVHDPSGSDASWDGPLCQDDSSSRGHVKTHLGDASTNGPVHMHSAKASQQLELVGAAAAKSYSRDVRPPQQHRRIRIRGAQARALWQRLWAHTSPLPTPFPEGSDHASRQGMNAADDSASDQTSCGHEGHGHNPPHAATIRTTTADVAAALQSIDPALLELALSGGALPGSAASAWHGFVLLSADSAALGVLASGRLVLHKVFTGYTVRHSRGGSQAQYEQRGGRRGHSVGGALRQAETRRLWQATFERLSAPEWQHALGRCSTLWRSGGVRVWNMLYDAGPLPSSLERRNARWCSLGALGVSAPRPRLRNMLHASYKLCMGHLVLYEYGDSAADSMRS